MAHIKFGVEVIRSFLQEHRIATLAELKQTLGSFATMTVFRKLRALGYRTSFSHRGKYYTLADIPQFDEQGLWSYGSVWFSRDGSLLATTERFVQEASAGWTARSDVSTVVLQDGSILLTGGYTGTASSEV